jgi:transcriptional regulator with AAA-type ATPase domain
MGRHLAEDVGKTPGDSETLVGSALTMRAAAPPRPGLRLVFSDGQPRSDLLAVPAEGLVLGRHCGGVELADPVLSREHARVDAAAGTGMGAQADVLRVADLDSRNGTFLDGAPVRERRAAADGAVLRLGRSLFLCHRDVGPLAGTRVVSTGEMVAGPALAAALGAVARAAGAGGGGAGHLLIRGETGSGKELAARAFHRLVPGARAFVAVNCAGIPASLADSLLFGARKGAYSGAVADMPGLLVEADGGVLFLDEVAELELPVQAKLLRVLESQEVRALGAARSRRVSLRICSATLSDLRARVAEGRFREDLFFRLCGAEVVLPALRERREEIPFLIARELEAARSGLRPHPLFVEACLLRPWPGNVRALVAAVREAAARAVAAGSAAVRQEDLPAKAGLIVGAAAVEAAPTAASAAAAAPPSASSRRAPTDVSRQEIVACLGSHAGNISAAARALGLHRTQLYRLIREHRISPD